MGKAVLDLVWGFIAFVGILAVSVLTRQHQDIRSFALATCVAFFAAWFYSTKPERGRLWLTALLVAFGGIAPVITMNRLRIAFTAQPFIVSFLVLSVCAVVLGVEIRWLHAQKKTQYIAALGCLCIITVFGTVFVVTPN